MKSKGLSQEALKLLACVTMLIDHVGATLVLRLLMATTVQSVEYEWIRLVYYSMRIIGRVAFPVYCFLLVEGAYHTRSPKKYALRLFVGMLLSEIPFDLAFSPTWLVYDWKFTTLLLGFNPKFNSVMMTLLLGFFMIESMKRVKGFWKVAVILPFYILAEGLYTDYAGQGILLIAVFALTRGMKYEKLLQLVGSAVALTSGLGADINIGPFRVPLESFALFALIPIFFYNGKKQTYSKTVRGAFYLFYPVHITILWLLEVLIFGG